MPLGKGSPTVPAATQAQDGLGETGSKRQRQDHASTGLSAATMRALSARMFAFYFRAPVKAFFRARIDYMGYARAINPRVQAGEPWSWRLSSPALLAHAIRTHGWQFVPNQVLPPLLANTAVGAILYTSYLNSLAALHEPSSRETKRAYPPPSLAVVFEAGFIAGTVQSIVAAPLDALQARFRVAEMTEGAYRTMWQYAIRKTHEIGPRGVFAGWSLSFVRDAMGFGAFFASFEFVKNQCFYNFVSHSYGIYDRLSLKQQRNVELQLGADGRPEIKPHYLLEPTFLLLAGAAASVTQSVIQHPIARVQDVHYQRLEWIDSQDRADSKTAKANTFKTYANAYRTTFQECAGFAQRAGGLRRWLYADFLRSTLRQVPSTSAGLIVFEIVRRKYSLEEESVKIHKDGYDILLV